MEWTRFRQPFQVPEGTRVISVQVYRAASQRFENRIKGSVWIDDVAILPDGAEVSTFLGGAGPRPAAASQAASLPDGQR